ncbi:uncharacterized protein DNG_04057 [Cephalotrichum gorgonifer]|uniref:Uncharacterized protein n=1 Tax=Cephalotrichum gorgonifer TaxID=2041049 RepID=A0AAE8MW78_9PEZI|nr:uncharacterized protein DNG_04057 [Cephalotrichum gorgonifer]
MQFSVVAILSLAAVALGSPNRLRARQAPANPAAIQGGPTVQEAAMTDRSGNIVPFDSKNVYLAGVDAGL